MKETKPAESQKAQYAESRMLRVRDAQEQLSLSKSKVYEMMASGELPSVRFGRAIRIPEAAIRDLCQKNLVGAAG